MAHFKSGGLCWIDSVCYLTLRATLRVVVSLRSVRTNGSHPSLLHYIHPLKDGGPCWIRTSDQLIKSQLLYQLS
jgi:hypothetical protein